MEPEVLLQWSQEPATGHILSQINPFYTNPIFLTFRRRIKSRLPFADIIRRLPYSTRFEDKG